MGVRRGGETDRQKMQLLFSTRTNQLEAYKRYISHYPDLQERNISTNQKDLKANLYKHNTKGDVVLMNIRRETMYLVP